MKIISALAACIVIVSLTNADEDCVNNQFFSHNYDAINTCDHILADEDRREFFCKKLTVHRYCPITCGVCGDVATYIQYTTETPSASPTVSPTASPTLSASPSASPTASPSLSPTLSPTVSDAPTAYVCVDNPDFRYQGKEKKSCTWIGAKEKRNDNLCKKKSVMMNCKIVCGECCEDDMSRKFAVGNKDKKCNYLNKVNKKKKRCPTSEINKICAKTCGRCCLDDPTFEFQQGKKTRKCAWLVGKKSRINKWCKEDDVKDACAVACESCVDYTVA